MSKYFSIVACVFVTVLLISNTVASKFFQLGPFIWTGAIIVFPISYIFGDILTEVYGYTASRKVIWTAFFCLALMSFAYWIVGLLPAASIWQHQEAYLNILGVVPRIALASLVAFWAGEFTNSYVLAKLKVITQGKHLWVRTISSTFVGQAVDTTIFLALGFIGVLPPPALVAAAISGWLFKVIYEALATPITYKIVRFLKQREGIDVYDVHTNFNPLKIKN